MTRVLTVLGIETSCDETAAAVVRGTPGVDGAASREILANQVLSQLDDHAPYGGVVPEIAARAHIDHLDGLITKAMTDAKLSFDDLDAIAVTAGPGLIGGVMVGLMTAKGLAAATGKPLIAVNHLAGHALTVRLTEDAITFPYLLLLVSGGHCQLLAVAGPEDYRLYGSTIDDAVGEAFDKTAKLLGLPYPGGPAVEQAAKAGDAKRFDLPRPLIGRPGADFSFSGLKTAVRREVERLGGRKALTGQDCADICASFQATVADILTRRTQNAIDAFRTDFPDVGDVPLVVAGGVAANETLRGALADLAAKNDMRFAAPPISLCTDNAVMIAWAGLERFATGKTDPLDTAPKARWPLGTLGK